MSLKMLGDLTTSDHCHTAHLHWVLCLVLLLQHPAASITHGYCEQQLKNQTWCLFVRQEVAATHRNQSCI